MAEPSDNSNAGPILMGLAYIGLVVFIMVFCAKQTSNFDDFSGYWGLFATLIGVATGAIPSFFFKAQADNAQQQANNAQQKADQASAKAELLSGALDPGVVQQLRAANPHLF